MPKVKKIYEDYKTEEIIDEFSNWDQKILYYASTSSKEMNELIKLFEEENDEDDKFELARILASLNYKNVVNFFVNKLNAKNKEVQYDAALELIKLGNSTGVTKILEWAHNPNKTSCYWIIEELITANNNISKNLLQELSKKYDYIKQIIQDILKTKN